MDEKTIIQKLNEHRDLSDAMITRANRYFLVIDKICQNTLNVQNILFKIYAYNPEARIHLNEAFTNYVNSLDEQAEAVTSFAESFENMATFWEKLLQDWKAEVLD